MDTFTHILIFCIACWVLMAYAMMFFEFESHDAVLAFLLAPVIIGLPVGIFCIAMRFIYELIMLAFFVGCN